MRSRRRVLVAVVAVVLVSASAVIAGYIYLSSPLRSELRITPEGNEAIFILCPSKASDMGLCNTDERDLHAKYSLVVQPPPPPEVGLRVECKALGIERLTPFNPLFPRVPLDWPFEILTSRFMDATSNFTCSLTRTGERTFELNLAFIADPDNAQLMARYLLVVTIGYDEPLLPWMPLVTRNANGTGLGDLCLLGYHIGKHPPPGTPESGKPLGEFRSCEQAASWQRDVLHIPPPYSRADSSLLRVLPTIDGFMGLGEWSDAEKLSVGGGGVDASLYAKNDEDFLYVAADVTPTQQIAASSRFEVRLYFDVGDDSAWVGGRDVVYVYSSNPSYSGFIRYSDECGFNFLYLRGGYRGDYSELSPCATGLKKPGAIQGRYYERPVGHWVVEMKIPLRGEGGIMTEPGQVVGMEIGIWGGADSYKDPGFYGRLPRQLIDLTLASGVGVGNGTNRIDQSQSIQATVHFQRTQAS